MPASSQIDRDSSLSRRCGRLAKLSTRFLLACLLLAGCASKAAQKDPLQPVTFSGDASTQTPAFNLSGDTYRSDWTIEPGCFFSANLQSPDVAEYNRGAGQSGSTIAGQTWLYHVGGPARFYLQVIADCRWTVTLTAG